MKVGFTGTRHGMTLAQYGEASMWLMVRHMEEFHHGCCVGADEDAVWQVVENSSKPRIVAHPPKEKRLVSQDAIRCSTVVLPALTYLARNRAIVDATEVLIACPNEMKVQPRGGTWYTVKYASDQGKPILIIWPDGTKHATKQD